MFASAVELEASLADPTPEVIETFRHLDGDLIILGAAGKMGPTLARMARLASDKAGKPRRIIAVARYSNPEVAEELPRHGVEIIRCDLLDPHQVEKLPAAANAIWMGGMKFGTAGQAHLTWAMNTLAPALVCRKFAKSRMVAFSSGNVYGLSPVSRGGSTESDPLQPVGEYALSALGRERIFEHFSRTLDIPMVLLRLNYAVEMRYGVLVDIAQKVFQGKPIDVSMGSFNVIWQGDANANALRAFGHLASPPTVLNVTGPETLSVRRVVERFAELFQKAPIVTGTEGNDALLSNAQRAQSLFGYPRVSADRMMEWIAAWIVRGGESLGKPTHFEARDGKF